MTGRPEVLFSEEAIRRRVQELGAQITQAFDGREICTVGLMKGCLVFMADLVRVIPLEMTVHFLRAASLKGEGDSGPPRTDIVYSADIPYADRDILLLDDIVDTGITLNFLLEQIRAKNPRSLKVCVLIDKPRERKIDVQVDWAAFTLEKPTRQFLVGYGLDYQEAYRSLPYIGTIAPTPRADDVQPAAGPRAS